MGKSLFDDLVSNLPGAWNDTPPAPQDDPSDDAKTGQGGKSNPTEKNADKRPAPAGVGSLLSELRTKEPADDPSHGDEEDDKVSTDKQGTPPQAGGEAGGEAGSEDSAEKERIMAVYELMTAYDMVPAQEDFGGSREELEALFTEVIPQQSMEDMLSSLHEDAVQLAQYMLELGEQASIDRLAQFFDQYLRPNLEEKEPTTEEEAYAYLKPILQGTGVFSNEDKLTRHLDEMLDDKVILQKGKEVYAQRKGARDEGMKVRLEQEKAAAEASRRQVEEFYDSLYEAVEAELWDKGRKEKVLEVLVPERIRQINEAIYTSPKAVAQLADFYLYFDEKTKTFDLSSFGGARVNSARDKARKENMESDRVSSALGKIGKGTTKTASQEGGESFWNSFKKLE